MENSSVLQEKIMDASTNAKFFQDIRLTSERVTFAKEVCTATETAMQILSEEKGNLERELEEVAE